MSAVAAAPGLRRLLDEARADPSSVPGGILAWFGRHDFPDGGSRAPVLSQQQWQGAYFLIENAALASGTVRPLPAVQAAARTVWPDEPVPIAI
ncbi:MAG: hypothetical protein QOC95_2016, partial [Thermoleophilaceae bacterium]|nr:hypothetical protein [Thermoleophilaceae bacterium]